MGANFHTAYADGATIFAASSMESPLSDLDRAISYGKNVIIHCDGVLDYSSGSGELTWSGVLRFLFVRTDGQLIQNTVAAGGVALSDNQMAYVDLSETSDAAVTVLAATLTTAVLAIGTHNITVQYSGDDRFQAAASVADADSIITTIACNASRGFSGDGGPATAAAL